ncbi:Polar-differentiation response regulator DivK [Candidatus Sulfobium mesophilum]|uniref:Polar-differentiation response regulator DivK n=1 Tax=Candidatus Sulfobium mesophilum TaxID=2016548 RepID=A0A2U3QKE6_9BACT|nr:Polar-differentiation response regulator DivK [Candidatus Sulfobium mesophilum]
MEEIKKSIPIKILVVDDNRDNRELVVKVLKSRGYEMVEAIDGEDALQKAEERPSLILMDISLPKIDGYEVTRRLKMHEEYRDIPVVALTAHVMKGDKERAIEAGCVGYIPKPIDVHELPEQIKHYLDDQLKG